MGKNHASQYANFGSLRIVRRKGIVYIYVMQHKYFLFQKIYYEIRDKSLISNN